MNFNILKMEINESVREYAYRVLKENILNLNLIPGSKISEKEISDILSISRTPVREAFIRLSQEGLLEIFPQRGSYISNIDTALISEFRFLRATLESAVIEIACQDFPKSELKRLKKCLEEQDICVKNRNYDYFFKLDNEMHRIIFSACDKANIWKIIQEANLNYLRARVLDLQLKQSEIEILYNQHKQIIKAITDKNIDLGKSIILSHINKVISDVNELKTLYPDFFK